jgi:ATP synthase protein I
MSKEEEEQYSKVTKYYKEVGPYLGIGLQLAATVVLMFFLGRWIDSLAGTDPLFMLIFALFGIAAGIYNFIKTVLSLTKSENEKRK